MYSYARSFQRCKKYHREFLNRASINPPLVMQVISSYIVPPGKSLTRHLPTHLSPQITHLVQARPMAISMGNAIRYLKWEISHIPPDMQDDDVSRHHDSLNSCVYVLIAYLTGTGAFVRKDRPLYT